MFFRAFSNRTLKENHPGNIKCIPPAFLDEAGIPCSSWPEAPVRCFPALGEMLRCIIGWHLGEVNGMRKTRRKQLAECNSSKTTRRN